MDLRRGSKRDRAWSGSRMKAMGIKSELPTIEVVMTQILSN